jgi:hypothetical protein
MKSLNIYHLFLYILIIYIIKYIKKKESFTNKKTIVLIPTGGMCNRLRMISSFNYYCKKKNYDIKIIWNKTNYLNCNFNDLFKNNINIFEINYDNLNNKKIKFICQKKSKTYYNDILNISNQSNDLIFIKTNANYQVYESLNEILKIKSDYYKSLIPVDYVSNEVNTFLKNIDKSKLIGIHIRMGDFKNNNWAVSIDKFITHIDNEINKDTNNKFLVCSDDNNVINQLKNRYGDKILTKENSVKERNSVRGIQDSLIDFYLLANCKKIYKTKMSSFSQEASNLNLIDVINVS